MPSEYFKVHMPANPPAQSIPLLRFKAEELNAKWIRLVVRWPYFMGLWTRAFDTHAPVGSPAPYVDGFGFLRSIQPDTQRPEIDFTFTWIFEVSDMPLSVYGMPLDFKGSLETLAVDIWQTDPLAWNEGDVEVYLQWGT